MPKAYPAEFRARAVALVRAGKSVRGTAHELDISESCLHNWLKQDRIDRGESPGLSSREHRRHGGTGPATKPVLSARLTP